MLTGGCHCGRVRYEIRGTPFNATLCHCVDCRRAAGAPSVAWFTVEPNEFAVLSGVPHVYASSIAVMRSFCCDCGTQLTYRRTDLPHEIDVTIASLDEPTLVPPQDETFVRSRIKWQRNSLPEYPTARPLSDMR